jgi:cytochrome c-type biogenesis protein CcmE
MKLKHKRLTFVLVALGLLGASAALVLSALDENIAFFFGPTDVLAKNPPSDKRLRVGGLVEEGSFKRETGASEIKFRITDLNAAIPVVYKGILPDLFREGQGVVAQGFMRDGVFQADEVLAKHDENYMPPEVADALKKSGQWQHVKDSLEQSGQKPATGGAPK